MGKSLLVQQGWADNSFATYLVASMVSGVSVCAAMQPADTVLTRMYNRAYLTLYCVLHLPIPHVPLSGSRRIWDSVVLSRTSTDIVENTVKDPITGKVRGALYTNPIDCLWKTFKTEGIAGWYKGTTAHFLRIFPHTVVTLVANEVGWMRS
jgi:solute carrier family 25 protein 34/35